MAFTTEKNLNYITKIILQYFNFNIVYFFNITH